MKYCSELFWKVLSIVMVSIDGWCNSKTSLGTDIQPFYFWYWKTQTIGSRSDIFKRKSDNSGYIPLKGLAGMCFKYLTE